MKFIFKWFDLWIGIFVDAKKEMLYIFPVPMCGIVFNCTPIVDWWWETFAEYNFKTDRMDKFVHHYRYLWKHPLHNYTRYYYRSIVKPKTH